jgi:formiminotetrahydrofolate cyclodeaminase
LTNNVWNWNIDRFLAESASSAPTPGGGSVSAYVASLAASMVCMVANLTFGKEKYKTVEPEVTIILKAANECLNDLKIGLTRDMDVFGNFMGVFKLPKDTEEQKIFRKENLQKVLREATESPLDVARKSLEVLKLAERLAPIGNKGAISDVGVAAYLAESALKSAMLSVEINLPQIRDESYKNRVLEERGKMMATASIILQKTMKVVKERL